MLRGCQLSISKVRAMALLTGLIVWSCGRTIMWTRGSIGGICEGEDCSSQLPDWRFSHFRSRRRSTLAKTESDDCVIPRKPPECLLEKEERIHIVFVSAMWYREPFTQHETSAMIKSVIFQTRCPLWIHFLVAGFPETDLIPEMMESFGAWMMFPNPPAFTLKEKPPFPYLPYANSSFPPHAAILYSLHYIPTEWVEEKARNIQLFPLTHHAGVPGMCKFFMADILWQVDRAVYLDVDMLIGGDVQDLWKFFKVFDTRRKLLFYMSSDNPARRLGRARYRPFCSCQMVLDFERIRRKNATKLLVGALRGKAPRSMPEFVDDGDQWLFTWICKRVRGICKILPRMWNVSGCTKPLPFLGLSGRGKELNGSCWRVVHFNCLGHLDNSDGSYVIPQGWIQPVKWARSLTPHEIRQGGDGRIWKDE